MKAQFPGDLRENPRGWSQPKWEGSKLEDLVPPHKLKTLPIVQVDEEVYCQGAWHPGVRPPFPKGKRHSWESCSVGRDAASVSTHLKPWVSQKFSKRPGEDREATYFVAPFERSETTAWSRAYSAGDFLGGRRGGGETERGTLVDNYGRRNPDLTTQTTHSLAGSSFHTGCNTNCETAIRGVKTKTGYLQITSWYSLCALVYSDLILVQVTVNKALQLFFYSNQMNVV